MPLVMTLRPGDEFYVGDEPLTVVRIDAPHHVVIRTKSGQEFTINDTRGTEVLPDVVLAVGMRTQPSMARITVEAPRSLVVLRSEKYLEHVQAQAAAGKNASGAGG